MTMASRGFDVRLPAVPASVPAVRKILRDLLDRLDIPKERANEIVLAVNEACANAVVHAYPLMSGHLDVVVEDRSEVLSVVVRDAGVGMGSAPNSPGLGLGLRMIALVADSVRIDRAANGGTLVQMRFTYRAGQRQSGR